MENRSLRGGGLSELRGHNRAAVLRALLDVGPLSRTRLGQVVGLPPSVLSYISAELLEAGLIREQDRTGAGPPEASAGSDGRPAGERQRRGRQPVPLTIAGLEGRAARCAVSVHVGATQIDMGLVDLRARLMARRTQPIDHDAWGPSPGALVDEVARQVAELLAQHHVPRTAVLGAGVGVAGWVDSSNGVVRRQAQLGWADVALADLLAQALGLPVVVEDHVRAMAAAEAWFGEGRRADTVSFLYVGAVIGCSTIIGRQVHHGHHAAAGNVGSLPAQPAAGAAIIRAAVTGHTTRRSGARRAEESAVSIEAAASETALFAAAGHAARHGPDGVLARWVADGTAIPGRRTSDVLATMAERESDAQANELLRWRAAALAPLVAHVLAMFDPQLLVVAGAIVWDPGRYQLRLLRQALQAYAPEFAERLPEISPSAFGRETLPVSAGALVLREVYTPPLAGHVSRHGTAPASAEIRRRALTPFGGGAQKVALPMGGPSTGMP